MILLGALAVHRLEYFTTGSPGAVHGGAAEHVHGYLGWLVPLAGIALMLGLVEFIVSAVRRPRAGAASSHAISWKRLWALITASIVSVYLGQEMIEGIILTGDPLQMLDLGSLAALPLALALGLVLAFALRGAVALHRMLRCLCTRDVRPIAGRERARAVLETKAGEIAHHLAGRGPPALSSP